MSHSMKNREILSIGTRVKPAYDKMSKAVGTVVGYDEDFPEQVMILWDGNKYPMGGYLKSEIRPLRENEK